MKGLLMPSSFVIAAVLNFHMLSVDPYVNRTQSRPSFGQGNKVFNAHSMHPQQTASQAGKTHTVISTPYCLTWLCASCTCLCCLAGPHRWFYVAGGPP